MDTTELTNSRRKLIEELTNNICSYEAELNKTLASFNWSKEGLSTVNHSQNLQRKSTANIDKSAGGDPEDFCLLPSHKKLELYQNAIEQNDNLNATQIDLQSTSVDVASVSRSKGHGSFGDFNKLKRDLKRRRMKYRTTKTPPLTHTEELRELIALQMEMFDKK